MAPDSQRMWITSGRFEAEDGIPWKRDPSRGYILAKYIKSYAPYREVIANFDTSECSGGEASSGGETGSGETGET